MRRARAADFLGLAVWSALALCGGARAEEDVLARVEPRYREFVSDALQANTGGRSGEQLQTIVADARAELEQTVRDEPDDQVYAALVFDRPFDPHALVGLEAALGGPLSLLVARVEPSDRMYILAYDLTPLAGDTAAKIDAIEREQRRGWRPDENLYVLGMRGPSVPLPVSAADSERLMKEAHQAVASPLQFLEVRLTSTPRQLLNELQHDPRIVMVHLFGKVQPVDP